MVGPPRGRVTAARQRTLQLLLEHGTRETDGWVTAAKLSRLCALTLGSTYSVLNGMRTLGWVELHVDEGTEPRADCGVTGRKPRHAYRLTERGKTALIEDAMQGEGEDR